MKTFVTVIQENSFNGAANKLNTSAAEISRRITALEADFKVKLIYRTTRKLALTPIGEAYYEDCKRILAEIETAHQKVLSQHEKPQGTLTIYYIDTETIFPRLKEFSQQYDGILLNLNKIERIPDFNRNEADIIVGLSENTAIPMDCVRKKIGQTRYVLCCSSEYLSKAGVLKSPNDLVTHRYIAHSTRPRKDIIEFKNEKTVHVTPTLYLNDSQEMVKAALLHLGIIWVHEYRVKAYLKNKKLVEVLPELAGASMNVYMIYQYSRYIEPKIRAFVDFWSVHSHL